MDALASMTSGRRLVLATVALAAADVIGGVLAVSSDTSTWGEAVGFEPSASPPWAMFVVQLLLAWVAARDVRPPLGRVAAVVLVVICVISLIFGLFDGDLTSSSQPARLFLWGIVEIVITAVVGLLAAGRAKQLRRNR
jgi:peptidoglycan/LPS O-acetylase OafA/YrhL